MTDDVLVQEYDDMSSDEQGLYDQITEMFGRMWTHEETLDFMGELDDYGITTGSELEDAMMYVSESYTVNGAKAEFAEWWFCVIMNEADAYDKVVVDWTATYEYALRFDMFFIEFDGDFFFFNANF